MPPSKKRKISPPAEEARVASGAVQPLSSVRAGDQKPSYESEAAPRSGSTDDPSEPSVDAASSAQPLAAAKPDAANSDRLARFAALKSRATQSARSNLAEAKAEANRSAIDPTVLANLSRKSAIASHNLLKADTESEGGAGAFERKRAWDYTIEETEKWDQRMAQRKAARDNNAFQDYGAEAGKIYERQIRDLERSASKGGSTNKDDYERQKAEIIENAARSGGLEIVEMENGEMVAIDKDGKFYADSNNTGFVEQKPKKENVDRLVEDLRKAEEVRMRKRKERGQKVEDGDVTYINDKNKQFNMKLARFYDRYTTDIRESFERGTAI